MKIKFSDQKKTSGIKTEAFSKKLSLYYCVINVLVSDFPFPVIFMK